MGRFIMKRVLISMLIIFLVSVFAFSLMHILPGDPVRLVLGEAAAQEDVDALRTELNLDKPLLEQYWLWINGILHGDFGPSITYHRSVVDIMSERLPRTVAIGLPALLLSVTLGVCFGIISSVKRGTWLDQVITFLSTVGVGTPTFWVGIPFDCTFCPYRDLPAPVRTSVNTSTKRFCRYSACHYR